MKKIALIIGVLGFFIGGFYILTKGTSNDDDILAKYNLDGLKTKELVEKLENPEANDLLDLGASIFSDRIEFTDENNKQTYKIEGDEFYISIAPYINNTHGWGIHSLTGCKGELQNTTLQWKFVTTDGDILFEGEQDTYENGFAGFWLPKDVDGKVYVTYGDYEGVNDISTYKDSDTCITTLKLS